MNRYADMIINKHVSPYVLRKKAINLWKSKIFICFLIYYGDVNF